MSNLIRLLVLSPLLFVFCSYASINSTPLKYNISASGSHYPYYTNDPKKPGVLPEIIEKVLDEANITASHINLPTKRITKYLQDEIIDFDVISLEWLPKNERNDPRYVFSEPLIYATEMIVTLPKNAHNWQSTNSLRGKNIGTVLGYYYYDDNTFERVDFPSEKELMTALSRNRVEAALVGKLTALYWAKQLDMRIAFGAQHSHGFLSIRLLSKHKNLLPKINQAIKNLHSQGYIKNIEDKYLLNTPALN
ncbi:transporter substrate-binding domain-containing protein [Pseudoalteromonas carrageenovora]|uniref:substrate-binding periplasmic protein n=1 Tax=Pseudoalteromonas carrageenovora TaxID=227 RepID=UPI0026E3C6C4|nr:transporter substrate-binding domain-containing protein [Pseudoalteromonas carrageenovora]MDO6835019.1 transporter substrate-binding domain-containing protein [Pseudoalteromonas carrageenovora]